MSKPKKRFDTKTMIDLINSKYGDQSNLNLIKLIWSEFNVSVNMADILFTQIDLRELEIENDKIEYYGKEENSKYNQY